MCRNLKFLHIWRIVKFLHMINVEKSHISPHLSCTYFWNFSTWQIFSPRIYPWDPWQIWGNEPRLCESMTCITLESWNYSLNAECNWDRFFTQYWYLTQFFTKYWHLTISLCGKERHLGGEEVDGEGGDLCWTILPLLFSLHTHFSSDDKILNFKISFLIFQLCSIPPLKEIDEVSHFFLLHIKYLL